MSDLISRQAAIDLIQSAGKIGKQTCIGILKLMPPAQPLTAYVISDEDGNIKCSNCGSSQCWGNYCMDCGADMRGEEDVKVR